MKNNFLRQKTSEIFKKTKKHKNLICVNLEKNAVICKKT